MPPPSAIDLSVHPSVLAALREDGRAASLEPDASPLEAPPLSAWLIGASFREKASGGRESTTSVVRVVGVVRLTPGRTLSEDLTATTALLPGGVSVVGAAAALAAPSSSSSSSPSSLADLASAAAKAAREAGGASSGSVAAATDPESGEIVWLCGAEPVEVVVETGEEREEQDKAAATEAAAAAPEATAAAPPLSPAVAALLAPRQIDPWLSERFSAVRCGPLRVSGGLAGAAACLAELCGDGDDPGDAAFVVVTECSRSAPPPPSLPPPSRSAARPLVLAGDGPAPLSSSLLAPVLSRPHASPPPPAWLVEGDDDSAPGRRRPPPAPTAVFEPKGGPSPSSSPPGPCRNHRQELILDALALYPKTATAGEAAAALRAALSRQLRAAMAAAASSTRPLRASPFLLPGLPVFVTPLLPFSKRQKTKKIKQQRAVAKEEDKEQQATSSSPASDTASAAAAAAAARASLGAALRLPPGLPLLRPSAALTPSLSCACVAGAYRYQHYGQDSKDDKGWGCAYRSLQTLWSWFAENHFLSDDDDGDGDDDDDNDGEVGAGEKEGKGRRPKKARKNIPPTHAEIQSALVSLGDKPPTFVGSSQWIGALEISFALEHLAGIRSKVVPVARGAEMASAAAAGALVAHFRSQGTPVMVGGGVLAYTCLGCCYDSESGEASFLILDPHYCGRTTTTTTAAGGGDGASDQAATAAAAAVVKGGWVAWKKPGDSAAAGGPLFLDDAFYNLLCPQRPERV